MGVPCLDGRMKVEICVDNLESVRAAKAGGAARVELCASLAEGGLTPSAGFMREAVREFGAGVMVMLRPRSGDFLYDEGEMRIVLEDLKLAKSAGASGVVFGSLTVHGEIHQDQLAMVMAAAKGMEVTFHRAFDVTQDLSAALDVLIAHGVDRVLSSGGEVSVPAGKDRLAKLVQQAAGKIIVLPGGGVRAEEVADLAEWIGCAEIHLSARVERDSPMRYRRPEIRMGAVTLPEEYVLKQTDEQIVRRAASSMLPSR